MSRGGGSLAAAGLSLLVLGACASTSTLQDGSTSYRYSTFDFSGDTWAQQKRRCEALSLKPRHLGTDCGFWTCTSRYDCEPEDGAPDQSSVAQ